ncbi:MAG TPA: DNA primase [Xanthobacteraceae bacterium]|jgi:DNA primase|nr:DNA primase [Xanthobacteraceae bacterium]
MRFSQSFLDEIRARLPVSDVVRKRVQLKKAGREWRGLSPFNSEKTPSFFVNDQKGMWFDFSSGKNGSIFDFLMLTEGVSFREAVERLANMAGVAIPVAGPDEERREQKKKTLYDVVELAAKFFEENLQARTGARARGYLADRELTPETQARFRIGYATAERFALKEYLGGKGVSNEDMIEAGLIIAGDDIPVPYDRFRERVMFPITDFKGRVVGFGGRALSADVQAKYLNSPETPLFHKGWLLYNGANARAATQKDAPLIVVEGYVDVIAMVSAGFTGTVAPLGTALTEDQLALLWRMQSEPILCFDGDKAGRRAAYRAAELALPLLKPGQSLLFALLPEGQDPDDLIRAGGAEAMREVLAAAKPLSEMLWLRETETARLDTPERRAALEARLGEVVRMIADETVRRYYRDDLKARLAKLLAPVETRFVPRARFEQQYSSSRNFSGRGSGRLQSPKMALMPRSAQLAASSIVRGNRSALPPREALILLAVMNHPWLLSEHAEEFVEMDFVHHDAESLRKAVLAAAASGHAGDAEALKARLRDAGAEELVTRMERAISHKGDWEIGSETAPEDVAAWWRQIVTLHQKMRALSKELREAEAALGNDLNDTNFAWVQDVKKRLAMLEGTEALIEGFGEPSGRAIRTM